MTTLDLKTAQYVEFALQRLAYEGFPEAKATPLLDRKNARYVMRVLEFLEEELPDLNDDGELPAGTILTPLPYGMDCPDCGQRVDEDSDTHVSIVVDFLLELLITCTGYRTVDPNLVGFRDRDWQPKPAVKGGAERAGRKGSDPMIPNYTLRVVDVAAEAREMYGADADRIVGRKLPDQEWRLEVSTDDGWRCTYHVGATAEHVAADLAARAARNTASRTCGACESNDPAVRGYAAGMPCDNPGGFHPDAVDGAHTCARCGRRHATRNAAKVCEINDMRTTR